MSVIFSWDQMIYNINFTEYIFDTKKRMLPG